MSERKKPSKHQIYRGKKKKKVAELEASLSQAQQIIKRHEQTIIIQQNLFMSLLKIHFHAADETATIEAKVLLDIYELSNLDGMCTGDIR